MSLSTRRKQGLGLLTATHIVNDFYSGAVPAILPFLVVERQYSYAAISGVTLAATLFSSVVQPLFGVLADRRRTPWMIAAGMAVAGVGVGLSGVASGYVLTCVVIAMSGIGVAAYHPEATKSAREVAGWSARGMSLFSVGGNIGIALAPLVVAVVLGAMGTRGTPLLAVPAVAMAVVFTVARARARRRPEAPAAPATVASVPRVDDWRAFRILLGVVVVRSIESVGLAAPLALFVVVEFDQSAAVGSATLGLLSGAGVLGTVLGGWMADRIGRVRTVRIAYAVAPVALTAVVLAPSLAVAWLAITIMGLAAFVPFSVQMTLGHEYLPNRIGTASGVTLGLGITIGGAFAPVFGLLADHYGLAAALWSGVGALLVGLLISMWLPEPTPAREVVTEEVAADTP